MNNYRAMARLTVIGIAAATATLLVTMSIVSGFGRAYQNALLNFNAHLVIMHETEFREAGDLTAVHHTLRAHAAQPQATAPHSPARLASMLTWWQWGIDRYDRFAARVDGWPLIGPLVRAIDPIAGVRKALASRFVPSSLRASLERSMRAAQQGIVAHAHFLLREGLLLGQGKIHGVILKGLDPHSIGAVTRMRLTLPNCPFLVPRASCLVKAFSSNEARSTKHEAPISIILGAGFGIAPGTDLRLFAPRGDAHGSAATQFVPIHVVGTFESGLYDYDSQFLLMDLSTMQTLFQAPHRVTGIELRLDDPAKALWIADALREELPGDVNVMPWQEMHRPILEAVALERVLFALVMGLLVLVAVFNILATVLLRLLKEHRSIAILRAIGLSAPRARWRYFWRGMWTGAGGIGIGLVIGAGLATSIAQLQWIKIPPEIYFLSRLPVHLSGTAILCVAGFGLIACAAAAHLAARKVTDLPLLEALGRGHG